MRTTLMAISVTVLAIGGVSGPASPAQAASTTVHVGLQDAAKTVTHAQAIPGTVTLTELCTPNDQEKFTVTLTSSRGREGAPKTFTCNGVRQTVTWRGVPAGVDKFLLKKAQPSATTLSITLQISLP